MRIRTDDSVIVISGKHKGSTGKVIRTDPARERVYVENVNMVKKHSRPRSVRDTGGGGIIDQEGPIHVSNVMLLDPKDEKPTRVGVRVGDNGKRQRFSRRTGNAID
ncbi:50S ribosomal protein L24 [Thermoleophilia bacterium SCSIO 60948]|nr:50S ribosomal protein L24 [Thermoleophilia bacterium SCSIO 60948]